MYKPANHHYIPQLLLRNFCDGGQLWAGDKDTKRVFSPNPKNIFAEHNLNIDHDLEDIDIKDDKAEKLAISMDGKGRSREDRKRCQEGYK